MQYWQNSKQAQSLSGPFARTPGGHEQIVNKNKRG